MPPAAPAPYRSAVGIRHVVTGAENGLRIEAIRQPDARLDHPVVRRNIGAAAAAIRPVARELQNPRESAGRRIGRRRVEERQPVGHFPVRRHDVVSKPDIQRQLRRHSEVVLEPLGVVPVTAARGRRGIVLKAGRVQRPQQIGCIGVSRGGDGRAGAVEALGLDIAEVPGRLAAEPVVGVVDLGPCNLHTDGDGVLALGPLDVVLKVKRLVDLVNGMVFRPGSGRVRSGERDAREFHRSPSRRQSFDPGLDRPISILCVVDLRLEETREAVAELIEDGRCHHVGVPRLGRGGDLVHLQRAAAAVVGDRQRSAPVLVRLFPVSTAVKPEEPLLVGQV